MNIGNVTIPGHAALAPLAGVADSAFRRICKSMGASLVFSEMVSSEGLIRDDKKSHRYLDFVDAERPIGLQLFGSDPAVMAAAAVRVAERSPEFIDLNFGCPVRKVVSKGAGAALLRDVGRLQKMTKAVVDATSIPVTVKIRSGWSASEMNAVEVAQIAEDAGAAAVIIHPRLQTQYFKGSSDWSVIAKIKKAVKIPVIGNGDISFAADARRMYDETGCDLVMIGRGAYGNPWIFTRIEADFANEDIVQVTLEERLRVMKLHLQFAVEEKGERMAVREMRKHLAWYIRGMANSAALRIRLMQLLAKDDVLLALDDFFSNIGE